MVLIENWRLPWQKKKSSGGGGGGSNCNSQNNKISSLKRKVSSVEGQRNSAVNQRNQRSRQLGNEQRRSGGLRGGMRSLGQHGNIDIRKQKDLYKNFFNRSKDTLSSNSMVIDNQNELLSKQREILNETNVKYKNVNKDFQNVITGITMNDRVMDYDLSDSGTNKQLQRLCHVVTLLLIVAVISILFLKKFSIL
tara:strand:+ start:39 stop:620 length:582 start_codon:yes stop_codon:yes gene_type:complete